MTGYVGRHINSDRWSEPLNRLDYVSVSIDSTAFVVQTVNCESSEGIE